MLEYLILSTARWNILGYFAVVIINFLIDFPDHKLSHTKIIYVLIFSKVGTGFDPCKCEFCMMLIFLIFAIHRIVAPLFETSQHLYAIFCGSFLSFRMDSFKQLKKILLLVNRIIIFEQKESSKITALQIASMSKTSF